jgi:hypothetical protein
MIILSAANPMAATHAHRLAVHNPYARTKSITTKISSTIPITFNLSAGKDVRENSCGKTNRTASSIHIILKSKESTVTPSGLSASVKHIGSEWSLSAFVAEIMPA